MESNGKGRYLKVHGIKVPVSEEVFQAVCQQINRTRYVAKLEDRCHQPNHCHCSGDCETCCYRHAGNIRLGFEYQSDEAMYAEALCQDGPEDIMLKNEMWSQVYQYASKAVTFPLSWEFGQACDNIGPDLWRFTLELTEPIRIRFKLLINDTNWENGFDHEIVTGQTLVVKPIFG